MNPVRSWTVSIKVFIFRAGFTIRQIRQSAQDLRKKNGPTKIKLKAIFQQYPVPAKALIRSELDQQRNQLHTHKPDNLIKFVFLKLPKKKTTISDVTVSGVKKCFQCELCLVRFFNQIEFYYHLQAHYQPELAALANGRTLIKSRNTFLFK